MITLLQTVMPIPIPFPVGGGESNITLTEIEMLFLSILIGLDIFLLGWVGVNFLLWSRGKYEVDNFLESDRNYAPFVIFGFLNSVGIIWFLSSVVYDYLT